MEMYSPRAFGSRKYDNIFCFSGKIEHARMESKLRKPELQRDKTIMKQKLKIVPSGIKYICGTNLNRKRLTVGQYTKEEANADENPVEIFLRTCEKDMPSSIPMQNRNQEIATGEYTKASTVTFLMTVEALVHEPKRRPKRENQAYDTGAPRAKPNTAFLAVRDISKFLNPLFSII